MFESYLSLNLLIECKRSWYTLTFDIAENSHKSLQVSAQGRVNSRGIDGERN